MFTPLYWKEFKPCVTVLHVNLQIQLNVNYKLYPSSKRSLISIGLNLCNVLNTSVAKLRKRPIYNIVVFLSCITYWFILLKHKENVIKIIAFYTILQWMIYYWYYIILSLMTMCLTLGGITVLCHLRKNDL